MPKLYNPLEHSVVQALMKPDGCNRFEVERHGHVHALLNEIIAVLDIAYWNVKQSQFDDREDWQFLEIPGFEYRSYTYRDCDCGAESPVHGPECRLIVEHDEWNTKRLDAISDPSELSLLSDKEKGKLDFFALIAKAGRRVHFDRSERWEKQNPHPPCTCGAERDWVPLDYHLPTCSPTLPNLKFGEAVINWYKYPGRGTSTNVDWDEAQWRVWFDQVIAVIRDWEAPALGRG